MKCKKCKGTKKTLQSIGEGIRGVELKTCPVCNGTGEVASEPFEVCEWEFEFKDSEIELHTSCENEFSSTFLRGGFVDVVKDAIRNTTCNRCNNRIKIKE